MHDFDPNDVFAIEHEYRVYGDDTGLISALVDQIDYQWVMNWRWSPKWSRGGGKVYLRRNVQIGVGKANRTQKTLFLHTAIMERMGLDKPSPDHTLVDHRNGDGLDCRRVNLRWATPSMNRINIRGSHAWQFL